MFLSFSIPPTPQENAAVRRAAKMLALATLTAVFGAVGGLILAALIGLSALFGGAQ